MAKEKINEKQLFQDLKNQFNEHRQNGNSPDLAIKKISYEPYSFTDSAPKTAFGQVADNLSGRIASPDMRKKIEDNELEQGPKSMMEKLTGRTRGMQAVDAMISHTNYVEAMNKRKLQNVDDVETGLF